MRTDTIHLSGRTSSRTAPVGAGTPRRSAVRVPAPRPTGHAGHRHQRVLFLAPGHSPRLARHLQARRADAA